MSCRNFKSRLDLCLQLRAKRSKNLFQNQRSDAAGGVSIKALARQAAENLKAKYFFFRLGGNDGGEGAYTQYVTKADRVSNDVLKKKDKPP